MDDFFDPPVSDTDDDVRLCSDDGRVVVVVPNEKGIKVDGVPGCGAGVDRFRFPRIVDEEGIVFRCRSESHIPVLVVLDGTNQGAPWDSESSTHWALYRVFLFV